MVSVPERRAVVDKCAKAGIHCFAITAPPGEDPQAAVGYGLLSLASVSIAGVVQIGAGEAAKGLGEALSTVELDDLRKRVEALLGETGKRVVVLIDDIDRLDCREIQAIFRLVKLSAGFAQTVSLRARPFSVRAFASPGSEAKRRFADEPPPRSRRGSVVIALSRDPLDVPDHHVVIRRDVLPDLKEKRLLRHGHRADEAKQIMPLGHPQCHGGEVPAEPQQMATIPKSHEIGELDRPTRQPQGLIDVEGIQHHPAAVGLPGRQKIHARPP